MLGPEQTMLAALVVPLMISSRSVRVLTVTAAFWVIPP